MIETEVSVEKVLRITQHCLRSVGLSEDLAKLIPENLFCELCLTEDEHRCTAYVQLDGGVDIYPCCIGTKRGVKIGWGVSTVACIPGRHTLSNGDPGYPDDYESITLLEPSFETRGLAGSYSHPRNAWSAIELAIVRMVEQRLRNCSQEEVE